MRNVSTENLRLARADLIARLEASKKMVEMISRDIEAVDRMLERYGGQTSLAINDVATPVTGGEFSDFKLREAVRTVLKRHAPKSVKVPKIREEILAGGYKTTARNLSPPIFIMLMKLAKKGEVKKVGKGLYKIISTE